MFWSRNRRNTPSIAQKLTASAFDPLEVFHEHFRLAGTVVLDACPVCDGREIGRLWQLPQSQLGAPTHLNSPGSPFHNFYLDYLPLLRTPQQIFVFDICRFCQSIFRNPKDDDHASYSSDASKVEAFRAAGVLPFQGIVELCENQFPKGTKFVVDAACGAGQALALFRERNPNLRLLGLDLSAPSIKYMNSRSLDAKVVDLDFDNLDPVVTASSVDFILFYEAFEHVRRPVIVLKKLVRMLRPGGRLHFSSQYYGTTSSLQVRVGEPIYLNRHGLDWILGQLDVNIRSLTIDTKFRVTVQKQ